jgi:twitching motility two-component system response regulator PilH
LDAPEEPVMMALVVDDERDHRDLVCDMLEESGWRVEAAEDGIAGLGRIPSLRPDLVLLDVRMPQLDGGGLLKMLRSTPQGRHVRVVLTTGFDIAPEVRRLADGVLTKPFSRTDLMRVIRGLRAR